VNNGMVSITHLKVSHGDLISFQENYARIRGEEIRRAFYIEISVDKIIGKFLDQPVRMWRRTKTEWFHLLKTKRGCRLLLKSGFLQQLRSSMQKEDLERTKKFGSEKVCLGSSFAEHNRMKRNERTKKFGSEKVCLGSSFAEHNRMKRILSRFKSRFLSKRRNDKNRNLPNDQVIMRLKNNASLDRNSTYCSASPHQYTMKRRIKRIELPTHYSEVNHRTPKAVVSYGPNIGHIPHDIRLKDSNLPLRSGNGRGQNI
jgi:small subunit ribosomal protein S4